MNNHPRFFAVLLSVIGFGGVLLAVYGFLYLNRLASVLPPNMAPRLAIWAVSQTEEGQAVVSTVLENPCTGIES